jgi:Icc-related predicted phosphoesterase
MNILAVSDVELGIIYNPTIANRFKNVDVVISAGDLPYFYLEFIVSTLDKPLYYVLGNHSNQREIGVGTERDAPQGAINLHRRSQRDASGLLLAGLEGSLKYNNGPCQYTQSEYWQMAWLLAPQLLLNRIQYGRYLDVFVTHAAPAGIHDMDDLPHRGIRAFNWIIRVFQPAFLIHGHIHLYRNDVAWYTQVGPTTVINAYGYREFAYEIPRPEKPGLRKGR